jgi:biopolymer transport protein TolR
MNMREPLVSPAPTIARINVTPIIDVALVLVIILLITAPMLSVAEMELTLPAAQTRGLEDRGRINITLSSEGRMAIDEVEIRRADLDAELRRRLAGREDESVLVVVRADRGTPYQVVRGVLKEARAAGAERLAVATRQSGAKIGGTK